MTESRPILVGLSNPRTAHHLVWFGSQLARARSAHLVIVSVILVPPGQSLSTGARPARTQRRLLRSALQAAVAAGVTAETMVRAGYEVDEALAEVAATIDACLLVVGWSPTPRYARPVDSAMWRLSQDPPCDLLSVHYHEGTQAPRRILLPVRGGLHADLAAELAVALARDWNATVTVLRAIPEYVPEEEARIESEAFRMLWEERYPGIVQARSRIAGSIRDCILEEAAAHDLVLMGAAASSRSYPYPFGRLGEEIVERASCPVLIAKTERP
ncbi:MAG TPA: universal stress protein, partial [Chloroflexota bacterium]|nr:universal stress protein [Chloroflexota bacterium]